jgi:hypothetical protein
MALRIGTFNVQLVTDIQAKAAAGDLIGAGAALTKFTYALSHGDFTDIDTEQQAKSLRFVNQILDAPYDVVCLQEMWSLPAWYVMRDALKAGGYVFATGSLEIYHNLPTQQPEKAWTDRDVIDKTVASWSGPAGSGLAVASRLAPIPFLLPGDAAPRTTAFGLFEQVGGADGLADKGGFVFAVNAPSLGRTVVATSHLQADYSLDGGPSYENIRQAQLEQWDELIGQVAEAVDTTRIIVCGDLNVRAEPQVPTSPGTPPRTAEYLRTFGWQPGTPPTNRLGARLVDGWGLSSPDELAVTNQDRQRLDLVLSGTGAKRPAMVRHIMLARNLLTPSDPSRLEPTPIGRGPLPARGGDRWESDHMGVNAIVGPPADHGTPAQANAMTLDAGQSAAWITVLDHGAPRWLLLTEPGTYRVEIKDPSGADTRFLVFEPHDLSAPFAWLDPGGRQPNPVPISQQFQGITTEVHRVGGPLTPLYVRAQAESDATVNATVLAYRHAGITPDEAILIEPDAEHRLTVAPRQDDIWIELQPDGPPLDPAVVQTVQLEVHGDVVAVDVVDAGLSPLADTVTVPGAAFTGTQVTIRLRGPQRVLVRVQTATVGDTVRARWGSDMKVLHGALYEGTAPAGSWGLKLHVDDETGADAFGADEITVAGQADAQSTAQVVENDSDTGENISLAPLDPTRFVAECVITITEDDVDGDAVGGVMFPDDLPPGVTIPARSQRRPVRVGSGTYALFYNLSGWLRRKNL